ncbi:UDP-N-acetylglucosamine 1-carboxyvinyltransferase [Candidatus Falkowbacteria bacterium]|nr:UDP-N-acetylglucosamine 1-carboxyvinyltransferase [Candidatus Falkowbacteria bacterium]
MPKYIIEGGHELGGEISVKGAKNAALKIIPAALLSAQPISISNLPQIEDVHQALDLIKDLGAEVTLEGDKCRIHVPEVATNELKPQFANKLRASIVFVGPLLARTGEVRFPHPGGCVIGAGKRPIDLFLEGFVEFGAKLSVKDGYYHLEAKRLKGCSYFFTTISVTGTETLMMAATLAKGKTVLKNCACEPEIKALADYLNSQGAKIAGAGTPTMVIDGVDKLSAGDFRIVPDRIETGTFAILAAAAQAHLKVTDCVPEHIEILLSIFEKIGVKFKTGNDFLEIFPSSKLKAYSIKTHEYPGFPTDLQSPYTVLATQTKGSSIIHETIYDRRLLFTDMLTQMGADIIMCDPHRVVVNGPTPLAGRKLTSPDLRAGIAMIIAGLIAQGKTEIDNIYQIERGYEMIDSRLSSLGAKINKVE